MEVDLNMNKITVTEENFNEVLERLQKVCNRYKMFEFYRVLSEDLTEQKKYRRNSVGFRYEYKMYTDKNGERNFKRILKLFADNKYVRVTKHHFREDFDRDKNSYNAKYMYTKMKSLIHLDLSGAAALVISDGDKVQFLPFGGFIVWTDNNYTRFGNHLTIYKNIYFPDFFKGRISNLEEENAIRDKEWEEEAAWWHEQYEKDMERDFMTDDYE